MTGRPAHRKGGQTCVTTLRTSPHVRRGRVAEQALTLTMLRTVLAEERERDREHLSERLAGMQGDVAAMQGKMQAVETIVAQQVQDTVKALDRVTKSYDIQARGLQEIKEAQATLERRLTALPRWHRGAPRTQRLGANRRSS